MAVSPLFSSYVLAQTQFIGGLLRFANMFEGIAVPPKKFEVFVICVRCVES
jgi:hypothetical protein